MKRLILTILLLLIASPAYPFGAAIQAVCSAGGAAASCTRATIQQQETGNNATQKFSDGAFDWIASQISYSGTTGTLCSVDIYLDAQTGNETGTITAYLYSDDGGVGTAAVPQTRLTTCGTLDATTMTTDVTWFSFSSCNVTITNGTKYWIVMTRDTQDATNYPYWSLDSDCTGAELVRRGGDDTNFSSTASSTACGAFKLYIKE